MPDEPRPSLAFRLAVTLCIVYWALMAWWAFLIVGIERFSLTQWATFVFVPPFAVMARFVLKSWWARFWYGPWN
jgi:hypothetical protein